MEQALVSTLANKLKLTKAQVYAHYRGSRAVGSTTYKTLQVEVPRKNGSRIVYWGAIPLKVVVVGSKPIYDTRYNEHYRDVRSDLIQRLQAEVCELCGKQTKCEVHHVRKLANLKTRYAGRREKPDWVKRMIAMQRKTLVVCAQCHADIHAGKPTPSQRK